MRKKQFPVVLAASILVSIATLLAALLRLLAPSSGKPAALATDDRISPYSVSDQFDPKDMTAIFDGQRVPVPGEIAQNMGDRRVLGVDLFSQKYILVDLSTQTLHAYENGKEIFNTLVSTGKWAPTPTGTFHIWSKFKFTKMSGGSGNDYYYLPNVPNVMFFSNGEVAASRGFSLHGTYWHNNFGHPMSHGCVNMRTADAGVMFDWTGPVVPEGKNSITASATNPGTEIIISGTAPRY